MGSSNHSESYRNNHAVNVLELPSPNDDWTGNATPANNPSNVLVLPSLNDPTGPLVPITPDFGNPPAAQMYNPNPCPDGSGCRLLLHDKVSGYWAQMGSAFQNYPGCTFSPNLTSDPSQPD